MRPYGKQIPQGRIFISYRAVGAGHARPYNPIKKQPPAQASYLGGRLLF